MNDDVGVDPLLGSAVDWPDFRHTLFSALCAARNPIADDPVLLEQMMQRAGRVLAEVGMTGTAASALDDDDPAADLGPSDSEEIGTARAFARIHPLHSIRAAHILFDVALPVVLRTATADADIVAVVSALHRSVMSGIARAALAYVDTLLLELRNTRIEERRRMSRELHDEIAHTIGRALVVLESSGLDDAGAGGPGRIGRARTAMIEALDEVRRLSGELRRTTDVADVDVALRRYLTEHGLQDRVSVSVLGDLGLIPLAYGEEIYFTLREAVRNAVAYGQGAPVVVRVHVETDGISAEVTDRGQGIDDTQEPRPGHGQGIHGMRERVELLQGTFSVTSARGCGTRVAFHIPLAR